MVCSVMWGKFLIVRSGVKILLFNIMSIDIIICVYFIYFYIRI